LSELLSNTELSNKQADDEWLQTMSHYKSDWEMELERRKFQGITSLQEPLPHPDDIIVDFRTGKVEVRGPMSKEELIDLQKWLEQKNAFEQELENLENSLKSHENEGNQHFLPDDMQHVRKVLAIIDQALDLRASPAWINRLLNT
jgi:hypothetical protein